MSEIEQLEQAILALESQRAVLGDAVVEASVRALRERLGTLRPAPSAEQRKQVTILFADISGFTRLSEQLDAEELGNLMNAVWERLDAVVVGLGGRIDKHIGDAVMALWGADLAREDDPARAVRAGLAMQQELARFSAERSVALAMRVGINTGLALIGAVGTTGEVTALGDAVNLASRLEHAAPVGGVLIAHTTYRQIRGLFDVEALPAIAVRGKREPVQVYLVRAAASRVVHPQTRGIEGVETPLIGRLRELGQLQRLLTEVITSGQQWSATILAEAGMGKSRLLHEFRSWSEGLAHPLVLLHGRATEEMLRQPYALLRDIFARAFEIQDSDPAELARHKFEQGLLALGGADAPELLSNGQLLGQLLGYAFASSPHLRGIIQDSRQIKQRGLMALVQLGAAAARRGAIVLMLDDLHWADDASLDALRHLAVNSRAQPLCLIALARPSLVERAPGWAGALGSHTQIELVPLSGEESRHLIAAALGAGSALPPQLEELIARGAEGNPFYLEELLKMLMEDGTLVYGADGWAAAEERLAELRVPPTLTGVLQARLDSLSTEERGLLQRAAMIGRTFWDSAVAALGRGSVDDAVLLARLEQRGIIHATSSSAFSVAREYAFKHALLREVTYEMTLRRERRAYHRLAADWMIGQSGDRVDEYAAVIASHYERAGAAEEASSWYRRAGQRAQLAYANHAALSAYERALELAAESTRPQILVALAAVLDTLASTAQALELYQQALPAAEQQGDAVLVAVCERAIGNILRRNDRFDEAWPWLERARRSYEQLGELEGLSQVLADMGGFFWMRGDLPAARAITEESLAVSIRSNDPRRIASARHMLANIITHEGDLQSAWAMYEANLPLFASLGDKRAVSVTLNNLGNVALLRGDLAVARHNLTRSLALVREIGETQFIGSTLSNLGNVALAERDAAAAAEHFRESFRISSEAGPPRGLAYALAGLAAVALLAPTVSDPGRAIRLAAAADARLPLESGNWEPEDRIKIEQTISSGRALLGEVLFAEVWSEGASLDLPALRSYVFGGA